LDNTPGDPKFIVAGASGELRTADAQSTQSWPPGVTGRFTMKELADTQSTMSRRSVVGPSVEGLNMIVIAKRSVWHLLLYGVYFMMPGMVGSFAVRTCVVSVACSFAYNVNSL